MRGMKEGLSLLVTISIFLIMLSLLFTQYKIYCDAYRQLGRMIQHPSVGCGYEEEE